MAQISETRLEQAAIWQDWARYSYAKMRESARRGWLFNYRVYAYKAAEASKQARELMGVVEHD